MAEEIAAAANPTPKAVNGSDFRLDRLTRLFDRLLFRLFDRLLFRLFDRLLFRLFDLFLWRLLDGLLYRLFERERLLERDLFLSFILFI